MDFPLIDKYARLWTNDRKQIYVLGDTDNLKDPYQVRLNVSDSNLYTWTNDRNALDGETLYVYEGSSFREWTEDDGFAMQIGNQKITPNG